MAQINQDGQEKIAIDGSHKNAEGRINPPALK
jgi:hypothetical protein